MNAPAARITVKTRKAADLDAALPGLSKVWKQIKATCGTSQRTPKSLTFTDAPQQMMLDDGYLGRRFALNLVTMELSEGSYHVSSGEWAVHAGSNNDQAIEGIPNGMAVIDCEWHDYYGVFMMTVQVARGAIPAQLSA